MSMQWWFAKLHQVVLMCGLLQTHYHSCAKLTPYSLLITAIILISTFNMCKNVFTRRKNTYHMINHMIKSNPTFWFEIRNIICKTERHGIRCRISLILSLWHICLVLKSVNMVTARFKMVS